ncbi:hypothetical protein D3C85_1519820 [compost metagenome]
MLGLANQRDARNKPAEQCQQEDGLEGEPLAAFETHHQVEEKPERDADAKHQHTEGAQLLEVVLQELCLEFGGDSLMGKLGFDSTEHGALRWRLKQPSPPERGYRESWRRALRGSAAICRAAYRKALPQGR